MRWVWAILLTAATAVPALADIVVTTRTVRAGDLLLPSDLRVQPGDMAGVVTELSDAIGQEAKAALYAGRPIRHGDIGPPALVERNAFVRLVFHRGGLEITAEGRALGRGGVGDRVRVMNLASRSTLMGQIAEDGSIHVGQFR